MKPREIVINIGSEGQVQALHFDAFPLSFLGKMRVFRQSDIVFDEQTQTWKIKVLSEPNEKGEQHVELELPERFSNYEQARQFEVSWLHDRMRARGTGGQ